MARKVLTFAVVRRLVERLGSVGTIQDVAERFFNDELGSSLFTLNDPVVESIIERRNFGVHHEAT